MTVPRKVELLIADAPLSAHLATSVNDRPHVAPVWYGYRDGALYFMTGGKKLANIRQNPRVSISIEDAVGGEVAWNVTLLGRATVSDDPALMDWANGWIYDKYETTEASDGGEGSRSDESSFEHGQGTEELSDGGASATEEAEYALVEVKIGTGSWNVY